MKDKKPLNKQIVETYFNSPFCHRCGGLMISSFYWAEEAFIGRACRQCGDVIDLNIAINRLGLTLNEDEVLEIILFPELELYRN